MKILSLANQKGGVGKTTLTSLLAFYLSEKRKSRVLVVDADSQRNLTHSLRRFRVEIPTTALFEEPEVVLPRDRQDIALIHGTAALANLERATSDEAQRRVATFSAQLQAVSGEFDYCLIDPPPTLGIRMVAALASADAVVVPIELEEFSTQGVKDMLQTIYGIRHRWNRRLTLAGLLPNRFTASSTRQKAALRALFEQYPQFVLAAKVSTRSAIPRALEEGIPVWSLPNGVGRDASAEVLHAFEVLMGAVESRAPAAVGEAA